MIPLTNRFVIIWKTIPKIKRHNQCGVLFVILSDYFALESQSASATWLLADTSSASSRARSALEM